MLSAGSGKGKAGILFGELSEYIHRSIAGTVILNEAGKRDGLVLQRGNELLQVRKAIVGSQQHGGFHHHFQPHFQKNCSVEYMCTRRRRSDLASARLQAWVTCMSG